LGLTVEPLAPAAATPSEVITKRQATSFRSAESSAQREPALTTVPISRSGFFQALESAVRFELADDRLTIFYDGGRSALNFVNDSSSKPAEQYENFEQSRDAARIFL
jgi:hypothetical protein